MEAWIDLGNRTSSESVMYPIIIHFVCKDSALYGCTTR